MASVQPTAQIQPFTTPPWESTTPMQHIDANFGERKWAELKKTLSTAQNKWEEMQEAGEERLKDTWEDIRDMGESKWENVKGVAQDKWEDLKDISAETLAYTQSKWDTVQDAGREKLYEGQRIVREMVPGAETIKGKGKEVLESGKDILREKADVAKETIGVASEKLKESVETVAEKGKEKLKEAAEVGKEKILEATKVGKEKIIEMKIVGEEKLEAGKEKLAQASEIGKEKINEAWEAAKNKGEEMTQHVKEKAKQTANEMKQSGATITERAETVLESIREFIPATNLVEKESEIAEALMEARSSHEHITDKHPPPSRSKSLAQSLKEFLERSVVYSSPAPYSAVCPVLGPDMCPASVNMTYKMPW